MAKKRPDITILQDSKTSIRFKNLERILKQHGWSVQSTRGSHHVYSKDGYLPIMMVRPHGKHKYCHPRDVNKVIEQLEIEEKTEKAINEQEEKS